uniref:Zinc finger BED domain-containing protein 5 n=1 Tax=Strongyloides papillosus TaxID=174720 RepID=A0A0N5CG72_STREA
KLLCDSLTKNSVVPIKNIFITKEKGSKTTENNSNVAVKVSETSKNLTELSQVQSTSIEQDASRTEWKALFEKFCILHRDFFCVISTPLAGPDSVKVNKKLKYFTNLR